jgi:hypothetical protein
MLTIKPEQEGKVEKEKERKQNEKTEISLAEIFFLNPETKKGLHSHAAERYYEWLTEVFKEIDQLTGDGEKVNVGADLDTYLNDDDKTWAMKYKEGILEWRHKCTNIDKGYSPYPYNTCVTSDMFGLRSLIRKAYKARAEKLEAERKKIEWEEKWDTAYEAISPPDADARRYLNPGEYQKYEDSIPGAVDAYLAKGKSYVLDSRATYYLAWISIINDRRRKEQERITANLAAQKYNERLNKEIEKLKSLLYQSKKDLNVLFKNKIKDKRYTGHNFDYVISADAKTNFDGTLVSVANRKLEQLVPDHLRQYIDVPTQYRRIYFPLPTAEYSLEGVPCLDFCFDIFAVAYAGIRLKPVEHTFGNYVYNLPWRNEKGHPVPLEEPEFLGYYYLVLTPDDIGGYVFWKSVPLLLLRELLSGETKPSGTTISAASDGVTVYRVPKFKEEVAIPDSFAGYLRNIGNIDEMVSMGIMSRKIASVAKSEIDKLKIEHEALPLEEKTKRKNTKKAKAFQLFSEGKDASSPEVKALGLHKSTRFKYFNQYLAVHKT